MAGANPLVSQNRPDLRTVTITSSNTAQFCFDQAIAQVPSQTAFTLGGYLSDQFLASTNPTTIDTANNHCVDATFPSSIGDRDDIPQYSFGQVSESAVLAQVGTGFVGNRADSTALTGSNSHSGTAGHTIEPDLTGVTVDNVSTGNTLDYIYDQNVQISTVHLADYTAYYADGTVLTPSSAVAGGNVVKVTFSTPLSSPTHGPVVTAVSEANAVNTQTVLPAGGPANPAPTGSTTDAFPVSGTSGATTTRPDLISATLSTDGTFIDYQFDKPIAALPASGPGATPAAIAAEFARWQDWGSDAFFDNPSCIQTATSVLAAAGVTCGGTVAPNTQLPNNVVRAYYSPTTGPSAGSDTRGYYEYLVKASVLPGAVVPTGPGAGGPVGGLPNGYGEAPIGDNQGAFASGFTSGPDAFRVTFTNATNTATILFDQRVFGTTPSSFVLLDANGTPLPGGTGTAAGPAASVTQTPGSYQITVSFTGGSVANAKALEIRGPAAAPGTAAAAFTYFTSNEAANVQQIVSPTGSAAILKPGSKLRFVKVHATTKHHKKHKKSRKHRKG
jgi:hypothetical protein